MTCIVGLVDDNGDIIIGGDSAGVAGLDITVRTDEKVWKQGGFVYGFAGSYRMGQILRYKFNPAPWDGRGSIQGYIATSFMDKLRKTFKKSGFTPQYDGAEYGGRFLVGHQGYLFGVYEDFQFGESKDGFLSIGCGENFALGALYASRNEPNDVNKVRLALDAAVHNSGGVRPPIVIKKLKTDVATR